VEKIESDVEKEGRFTRQNPKCRWQFKVIFSSIRRDELRARSAKKPVPRREERSREYVQDSAAWVRAENMIGIVVSKQAGALVGHSRLERRFGV